MGRKNRNAGSINRTKKYYGNRRLEPAKKLEPAENQPDSKQSNVKTSD